MRYLYSLTFDHIVTSETTSATKQHNTYIQADNDIEAATSARTVMARYQQPSNTTLWRLGERIDL